MNSEYESVMKYVSPPINPGVRKWCGVQPDVHHVEGIDVPFSGWVPPAGTPYSPQIEDFGFKGEITMSKNTMLRTMIVAIIIYLVWRYYKK